MPVEEVGTLIVGGGQAGIAMSEHLSNAGEPHIVLERHRIAERWRSERWDSLVANGPAWHDRFPGMQYANIDPDAFPAKEAVADYFVDYATMINAPVHCGVEVLHVQKSKDRRGFDVTTSSGEFHANNVVAATGAFQRPVIPKIVPEQASLLQIHSNGYKNPAQLPDGAVLVVGAGSSGSQIADELLRAGKRVHLSVGPHDRPPRRYRGRDFVWWLGVLGKWEVQGLEPGLEHVTIAVSGAHGGQTVNFRNLAAQGMTLVGLTQSFDQGVLRFANDLGDNIAQGDSHYLSILDEADAYVERNGLGLPEDPEARRVYPEPDCVASPLRELNLQESGVTSIIWATGYASDYSWMNVDVFDDQGKPSHQRGISPEPGIYFLGLAWQSRRGSSFIWGVWHDAKFLADQIAIQSSYLAHHGAEHTTPKNTSNATL